MKTNKQSVANTLRQPSFWVIFLAIFIGLILLSETVLAVLIHALGLDKGSLMIPLYVMPFAALIIAGFVFFFFKHTNDMALELSDKMEKFAAGDFSSRIEIKDSKIKYEQMDLLYRNFNLMADEISSVKTLREDFVREFSHEFKTPISSINGFANLLLEGGLTEEENKKFLKIIADESVRLWHLADNTLTLSKIENQTLIGETEELKLDGELSECIILLQRDWESKNISLDADLEPIAVKTNPALLRQVWVNLLNNAVKFTPEGGKILVSLKKENGAARVSVTDSGAGISEEDKERVFERYYRANKEDGGSGLGLTICKRIIDKCGGKIFVENGESGKCTFTVILPGAYKY